MIPAQVTVISAETSSGREPRPSAYFDGYDLTRVRRIAHGDLANLAKDLAVAIEHCVVDADHDLVIAVLVQRIRQLDPDPRGQMKGRERRWMRSIAADDLLESLLMTPGVPGQLVMRAVVEQLHPPDDEESLDNQKLGRRIACGLGTLRRCLEGVRPTAESVAKVLQERFDPDLTNPERTLEFEWESHQVLFTDAFGFEANGAHAKRPRASRGSSQDPQGRRRQPGSLGRDVKERHGDLITRYRELPPEERFELALAGKATSLVREHAKRHDTEERTAQRDWKAVRHDLASHGSLPYLTLLWQAYERGDARSIERERARVKRAELRIFGPPGAT